MCKDWGKNDDSVSRGSRRDFTIKVACNGAEPNKMSKLDTSRVAAAAAVVVVIVISHNYSSLGSRRYNSQKMLSSPISPIPTHRNVEDYQS